MRGLRGVGPQGLVQLAGALAARGEPCDALFEVRAVRVVRRWGRGAGAGRGSVCGVEAMVVVGGHEFGYAS